MPEPDPTIDAIAQLLERSGHTSQEARRLAEEAVSRTRSVSENCTYGGLHAEDLGRLWAHAAASGKRRLLLEITAEGLTQDEDCGHLQVEVKGTQTWEEWEEERQAAALRAVN